MEQTGYIIYNQLVYDKICLRVKQKSAYAWGYQMIHLGKSNFHIWFTISVTAAIPRPKKKNAPQTLRILSHHKQVHIQQVSL